MSVLVDHFERRLGPMLGQMRFEQSSPFSVAAYRDGAGSAVTSYTTLGLSKVPLRSRYDGRSVRLELFACEHAREDGAFGPLPSVLDYAARQMITAGQAVLRGDLLDLGRPVTDDSALGWLYAALPIYYDAEFSSVELEDASRVIVIWLLPIGAAEAAYVRQYGWRDFEGLLLGKDPDVLDLTRPQILNFRPGVSGIRRQVLGSERGALRA